MKPEAGLTLQGVDTCAKRAAIASTLTLGVAISIGIANTENSIHEYEDPIATEYQIRNWENEYYGQYIDPLTGEIQEQPIVYSANFTSLPADITVRDDSRPFIVNGRLVSLEVAAFSTAEGQIPFFRNPTLGPQPDEMLVLAEEAMSQNDIGELAKGKEIYVSPVYGQPYNVYDSSEKFDTDRKSQTNQPWRYNYNGHPIWFGTYFELRTKDGQLADPYGNPLPDASGPYYTLPNFLALPA